MGYIWRALIQANQKSKMGNSTGFMSNISTIRVPKLKTRERRRIAPAWFKNGQNSSKFQIHFQLWRGEYLSSGVPKQHMCTLIVGVYAPQKLFEMDLISAKSLNKIFFLHISYFIPNDPNLKIIISRTSILRGAIF